MNLAGQIAALLEEINGISLSEAQQAEEFRLKYLSKKGLITSLFEDFRNVPPEMRREIGKSLNELKSHAENIWKNAQAENKIQKAESSSDYSAPGWPYAMGSRHPLSITANQIVDIFSRIGYSVAEGPEIEDDWHNFSALNFPENHPARDMQDTFFVEINPDIALRTHTSSVQIRMMENNNPPLRLIIPGRVYRNEAISARAHCFFHQVEALYIDEGVSFADMKQTLLYMARELFGSKTSIRLRPSYFPFTEPSAEMDISCSVCGGKGCNICKYSGWVEILGCGMVHRNVLSNCNIDPEKYTGFAIGMGIERIAMLRFQIKDLRLFSQNDTRFLNQFSHLY